MTWTYGHMGRHSHTTPRGQLITAARQRWRAHLFQARELDMPIDEAVEQFTAICFVEVRSVQGATQLSTRVLWKCVLTGIYQCRLLEAEQFTSACKKLSERYSDFTEPPTARKVAPL
jgi:hypothetical protein